MGLAVAREPQQRTQPPRGVVAAELGRLGDASAA
jgi:hypothetical protein